MNRDDFKHIACIRFEEAKVLLDNQRYDGAYYLSGYVIECGLKACIAKQVKEFEFPDKKLAQDCYTHDLAKLIKTAGLQTALNNEIKSNSSFEINWTLVKDWSEESRYQKRSAQEARDIYSAIADEQGNGVFKWVKRHW